ncbi:hypothetical protein DY000_02057477, partial [Brassica cretica]
SISFLKTKAKPARTWNTTMEEPFLLREEELVPVKTTWQRGQLTDELKKVGRLAAPMATVTIAQYLLPVISVMIAGHKGELQLSGVALATSFTNFSGFSIMFGLVGALDTLCGQAYGAKEYEKIGTYTYSAIASNIPIYPDISRVAGSYAVWLIPALFGHAIVIPSRVPKLFGPALALTTLLFHIAVCWSFVSLFGLGSNGAALAMSVSFWFYAVILACYVRFSTSCEKTRSFVSDDFVSSVKQFFHFGVPSTAMLCLEWWLFELLVLSSGLLPNPKLETFVLSIWRFSSQNTTWLAFGFLSSTINVMVITRFLLTQGLVVPLLYCALTTLLFHIPVCWSLVSVFGLGSNGAALAMSVSFWFYAVILACYVRFSTSCEKTRSFVSDDFVSCVKQFFHFGVPSAAMVCLEWWLFELLILSSGLLPNPKLETSVLSICLTTGTLHYVISSGIAAGVSTRVSNNLGAGSPEVARVSVMAGLCFWLMESVFFSTLLFTCRNIVGYAFSNSNEVVDYVAELSPLLCLSFILDGFTAVLNGVARGSGWQHIGAWNNVVAYYLVGAPVGLYLAFRRGFNGKGLWCGVVVGSAVQATILAIVTSSMNWKEQAEKARKRIISTENGLA